MPSYRLECGDCKKEFEVWCPIAERHANRCPLCGSAEIQRVWTVPMIQFRGSGFVTTDTREKRGIHGEGSTVHKTGRYARKGTR